MAWLLVTANVVPAEEVMAFFAHAEFVLFKAMFTREIYDDEGLEIRDA